MRKSMAVYVLFCVVWLMASGCNSSEPGPSDESGLAGKEVQSRDNEVVETIAAPLEENISAFLSFVEDRMDLLKVKHVKLANRIQQAGLNSESLVAFSATLDDLKKKRGEVQTQMKALKTANEKDRASLQLGMNLALEELAYSYDITLAQFSG